MRVVENETRDMSDRFGADDWLAAVFRARANNYQICLRNPRNLRLNPFRSLESATAPKNGAKMLRHRFAYGTDQFRVQRDAFSTIRLKP
jgi:hypothetical protein